MESKVLQMFSRLKNSPEGIDFLDYLREKSRQNYLRFKVCDPDMNECVKGMAIAIDEIVTLFEVCDDKLAAQVEQKVPLI